MVNSQQYNTALERLEKMGYRYELIVNRSSVRLSWSGHEQEWHISNTMMGKLPFQLDQLGTGVLRWANAMEQHTGHEKNYAVLDHHN